MPSGKYRKRLEVSRELYYALERRAIWLNMPIAQLANLLLWEGLTAAEERAKTPPVKKEGV